MLLGRPIMRAREVAVRSAVGASRLRLFRQFLFESVAMVTAVLPGARAVDPVSIVGTLLVLALVALAAAFVPARRATRRSADRAEDELAERTG